jgi:hypothetical protein
VSPIGKAIAERIRARGHTAPDPELLAEVDTLRQEVAELHERMNFAERLLSQREEKDKLGAG